MAAEKETIMLLKADLQCPCCYKKIRRTLCKFPQIRDQMYNEKNNEVTIKVVCCSPERIRDKLCCKGGKSIKSINILDLSKPKAAPAPAAEKPKAAPAPAAEKPKEKPKELEKPKEKSKEPEKPKANADKPKETPKGPEKPKETPKGDDKPKADGGAPPPEKPKDAPKPEPPKVTAAMPPAAMQMMGPGPAIVHGVPSVFPYPYNGPSHDAYPPGPYYHGYGFPPPSQPTYGHGYGYGYGYGYGGVAQHGHVNRDNYFSDENPQTCTIM